MFEPHSHITECLQNQVMCGDGPDVRLTACLFYCMQPRWEVDIQRHRGTLSPRDITQHSTGTLRGPCTDVSITLAGRLRNFAGSSPYEFSCINHLGHPFPRPGWSFFKNLSSNLEPSSITQLHHCERVPNIPALRRYRCVVSSFLGFNGFSYIPMERVSGIASYSPPSARQCSTTPRVQDERTGCLAIDNNGNGTRHYVSMPRLAPSDSGSPDAMCVRALVHGFYGIIDRFVYCLSMPFVWVHHLTLSYLLQLHHLRKVVHMVINEGVANVSIISPGCRLHTGGYAGLYTPGIRPWATTHHRHRRCFKQATS